MECSHGNFQDKRDGKKQKKKKKGLPVREYLFL